MEKNKTKKQQNERCDVIPSRPFVKILYESTYQVLNDSLTRHRFEYLTQAMRNDRRTNTKLNDSLIQTLDSLDEKEANLSVMTK